MSRPWYLDAVFYQIHPRVFFDSDGDGWGDLRGVAAKLDHVVELGADCVWLMPHYVSPRLDDGYDVADFYRVHPRLGDLEDFRHLVGACRDRGLRIVTDLVVNHVSSDHEWFRSARRDPASPYRDFFVWSETATEYADAPIIFPEVKTSNWTYDDEAGLYYWHRFFAHQPDLNYENPAVGEEILRVARFWLELGVDGFRVDAVPYLHEREGTACENLPETHAFCRRLRRLVDEELPDAVLICESNQPYETLAPYLDGEFHLGFHFPLMPRIWVALAQGRAGPVFDSLRDHPALPSGSGLLVFLRNHDDLTLEKVTDQERELLLERYHRGIGHLANGGIPRRLAPLVEGDERRVELLHALVLGLGQPVCLYYGDEIGMGEDPTLPDRDPVRTPMQWSDAPHGGFSTAAETCAPVVDDPRFGYRRVNVESARADPGSLYHRIRRLIARRKESPALRQGRLELLSEEAPELLAIRREAEGETAVLVYNFSDVPRRSTALGEELTPFGYRWRIG